jgi:hypothetical protein
VVREKGREVEKEGKEVRREGKGRKERREGGTKRRKRGIKVPTHEFLGDTLKLYHLVNSVSVKLNNHLASYLCSLNWVIRRW